MTKIEQYAPTRWQPGTTPIAVIMLSLNEGHHMEDVLQNLKGWAQQVFLVDSYSSDNTVDIALSHGVYVVQRKFRSFGDQWKFALCELPIISPWTMKLDPDERLTDQLKASIISKIKQDDVDGISLNLRLWFMNTPLPITQKKVRVWRTGRCQFSDSRVNEYPIVNGKVEEIVGELEHHDSPNLHHWVEKQNRYTTLEALALIYGDPLAVTPKMFGNPLERRMWLKKHFMRIPARYLLTWIIHLIQVRAHKSGLVGFTWARQRVWVRRMREDKFNEMRITGRLIDLPPTRTGPAHPGAIQVDDIIRTD